MELIIFEATLTYASVSALALQLHTTSHLSVGPYASCVQSQGMQLQLRWL